MDRASVIDSTQATVAVVDAPPMAGSYADPDGPALTGVGRLGNAAQREQILAYTRACLDL